MVQNCSPQGYIFEFTPGRCGRYEKKNEQLIKYVYENGHKKLEGLEYFEGALKKGFLKKLSLPVLSNL